MFLPIRRIPTVASLIASSPSTIMTIPLQCKLFRNFSRFKTRMPDSDTCGVTYALQAARDFFAINYGMASIGPKCGPIA